MVSGYLLQHPRTLDQARRDTGRMRDETFYARLEIANEFERLANALRRLPATHPAMEVIACLDERTSRIRGELQRQADRESRADDTED